MNFDDIMNGGLSSQSNLGENITDIFEVDEKFAMQSTRDLVDLITNTDSTDADIIQSALAMCETKTEVAVIMHLTTKALVDVIYKQLDKASELLEDTHKVVQNMGEEFIEQYAEGMMKMMIKRHGKDGFEDGLRDFLENGE